jgi:hypothetical protein
MSNQVKNKTLPVNTPLNGGSASEFNPFKPATKEKAKLRLALFGPSGSGKTYTALKLANAFGKTAVIDTERGSASLYADLFTFDVLELSEYSPDHYIHALHSAASTGYDVVVIDSLSHAWNATGGVLEMVDKIAKRSPSSNSFSAWREVTPKHNALVDALIGSPIHVIATLRSKTEYVLQPNERGKLEPKKVGLAPIQREGIEYEFTICGELDLDNTLSITKTRCSLLTNAIIEKPGAELAGTIQEWLSDGIDPTAKPSWRQNGDGAKTEAWLSKRDLDWSGAAQLLNISERDITLFYSTAKGFCEAVQDALKDKSR